MGIIHDRSDPSSDPAPCLGGGLGTLDVSPQPPRVCKAYTPPPSHRPFAGPHTESLSWHHSRACC